MIGILGGTFDPIHHGHLRLALEVKERLGLHKVHLIPSAVPPHRELPGTDAATRLTMLRAAVAREPALFADGRELQREGPSYTIDTLHELREEYGEKQTLCLITGMDAFAALPSWKRWQELIHAAHLVVVRRPGALQPLSAEMEEFLRRHLGQRATELGQVACGKIWIEEIPPLTISATQIRAILKRGGNPRYLVPDSVMEIIYSKQLYTEEIP